MSGVLERDHYSNTPWPRSGYRGLGLEPRMPSFSRNSIMLPCRRTRAGHYSDNPMILEGAFGPFPRAINKIRSGIASLLSDELRKCLKKAYHLQGRDSGIPTLVAALCAGPLNGLLKGVGGEHPE
jgi:hypothetical protein